MPYPRWARPLVVLLVIVGGSLPVVLYWGVLGRVPTLTAQDAIEILNRSDGNVVLVDVQGVSAFDARHLQAAQNWPLENIATISSRDQVPTQFQDKMLLLICDIGFSGAGAAQRLQALGLGDVYNIRGGIQAWMAAWEAPCATQLCTFESSSGQIEGFPLRTMAGYEQLAEMFAGFILKPIHIALSIVLVLVLIVTRRDAPDLVALKWALIFFFTGEICCVVHSAIYLFLREESYLFEYLHCYGMAVAFGFTTYALIEGLDTRGVKLSSPGERCAALDLCGPCIKYEDAPCGARRLFLLLAPLCAILAAIPLFAAVKTAAYGTYIARTFYSYSHLAIHQVFETRYCPVLAIVLFSLSFIVLLIKQDKPAPMTAKILFSAGFGLFVFSMFRLLFGSVYQDNLVWFDFWEELTELLYVVIIWWVLWVFRRRLFPESVQATIWDIL